MAVVTSKTPYQGSLGIGPTQTTMISPYAPSHRKPIGGNNDRDYLQNGAYMSPTESEFSDFNETHDSIRYD